MGFMPDFKRTMQLRPVTRFKAALRLPYSYARQSRNLVPSCWCDLMSRSAWRPGRHIRPRPSGRRYPTEFARIHQRARGRPMLMLVPWGATSTPGGGA